MKRRFKFKLKPRYVFLAGAVLCFSLIFLSFRYKERFDAVRNAVGEVVTPMQRGINQVGTWFAGIADNFKNVNRLIEENKRLKEQLEAVSYENKLLLQEKNELDNLRELFKLDRKYTDYEKVAARVTGTDSDNWYNVFTIDKGSNDGISVDMNVMAGDGLVGIVTEVGHNWSRVRSIIDDQSKLSGMFISTDETCMVNGNLELLDSGYIEVSKIGINANVHEGDEVYTSYISDKYLQGILVGYLRDVVPDPSGLTKSGHLSPAVDFNQLDYVLIITQLKDKKY